MVSSTISPARSAASWSSSIAASTACPPSWLQGPARPTSVSAVEKLSGDTDVIPGRLLPVRVAQQRRGMVRHDQRNAVVRVHLAPQLAQTLSHAEQCLAGGPAHRDDRLRRDELQLAMEIGDAGGDFIRQGLSVLGRTALHDVGDVYRRSRNINSLEDRVEQLARLADERATGGVLGRAGTFAHEYHA